RDVEVVGDGDVVLCPRHVEVPSGDLSRDKTGAEADTTGLPETVTTDNAPRRPNHFRCFRNELASALGRSPASGERRARRARPGRIPSHPPPPAPPTPTLPS